MIYKCEACGGVLVYDPDLGKMKCTQCGQTSERRFRMTLKDADSDTEEKEDGKRSFMICGLVLIKIRSGMERRKSRSILTGMQICWHLRCGITDRKIYRLHQNGRKQKIYQKNQSSRHKTLLIQVTGERCREND